MIEITDRWRSIFPGAVVGFLAMRGVANPAHHPELEAVKAELERDLRLQYSGLDRKALAALPVFEAYRAYYKPFNKSYHVLQQLESVAFKDRPIPSVAALVEAMFMAELKNGLLTAGHDRQALELPVVVDASFGGETYTLLRGEEQALKPGDMFMADGQGIISSVLYGPDARTRIKPETQEALFAVYAPNGIGQGEVQRHLEDIATYVRVVAPEAEIDLIETYPAFEVKP